MQPRKSSFNRLTLTSNENPHGSEPRSKRYREGGDQSICAANSSVERGGIWPDSQVREHINASILSGAVRIQILRARLIASELALTQVFGASTQG